MPISGLVITLARDEPARRQARQAIASNPRFTLGECLGDRLPLVLETASPAEDERAWEWLLALAGVIHADLVSVDFSDVERFGEGRHVLGMRGRIARPRPERTSREELSR